MEKSDEVGDDGDDEVVNYDDDDGDGNKRDCVDFAWEDIDAHV